MNRSMIFIPAALAAILSLPGRAQTVAISGTVLSVSGQPIQGAVCQFRTASNKAVTDAQGKYSFTGNVGVARQDYGIGVAAQGSRLAVRLERGTEAGVDLYGLDGRHIRNVAAGKLPAGLSHVDLRTPGGSKGLFLVRVRLGTQVAWHKLTLQGASAAITSADPDGAEAAAKAGTAPRDSLFCTHADWHGGLAKINGRATTSYAGTHDLRMFSSDPAWKVCAPPITFNFDNSPGVARYKQLLPDWVATEHEVLMEVCQSTYKLPSQAKKYTSYIADIKLDDGVAATGGNHLWFNTGYIAQQPNSYAGWYEVVGVQIHEAVHSYQPYYDAPGGGGFGESMPDAVRALTGFFRWPKGTKCSGNYTDPYQTGGKYWYYIEMKYPGFITSVWQDKTGDIAERVQRITGQSLAALAAECKSTGMP